MSLVNADLLGMDEESRATNVSDEIRFRHNAPEMVAALKAKEKAYLASAEINVPKKYEDEWNKLDDKEQSRRIKVEAGQNMANFKISLDKITKKEVIQDYAEHYLDRKLGEGWGERFNKMCGEGASDLMTSHLADFIVKGTSADLNKLSDWLRDKELLEKRPQEIWGALGLSENPEELHTMLASRSRSSAYWDATSKFMKSSFKVSCTMVAVGTLAAVCPHVGAVYVATATATNIKLGLSVASLAIHLEAENKEMTYLEDRKGQGQTPLGRNQSHTSPPASKAEREARGKESFHDMKSTLLEISKEQRRQLYGFNLVNLRDFIDDYQDVKKMNPTASTDELFLGAVKLCKSNNHFDVEKELLASKDSFFSKTTEKGCLLALSCLPGPSGKGDVNFVETPEKMLDKVVDNIFEPKDFLKDAVEETFDVKREREEEEWELKNEANVESQEKKSPSIAGRIANGIDILNKKTAPFVEGANNLLASSVEGMVCRAGLPPSLPMTGVSIGPVVRPPELTQVARPPELIIENRTLADRRNDVTIPSMSSIANRVGKYQQSSSIQIAEEQRSDIATRRKV